MAWSRSGWAASPLKSVSSNRVTSCTSRAFCEKVRPVGAPGNAATSQADLVGVAYAESRIAVRLDIRICRRRPVVEQPSLVDGPSVQFHPDALERDVTDAAFGAAAYPCSVFRPSGDITNADVAKETQRGDQAFQSWPGRVSMPDMALRVSMMQAANSASCR